jgi:hypothetical protein
MRGIGGTISLIWKSIGTWPPADLGVDLPVGYGFQAVADEGEDEGEAFFPVGGCRAGWR